MKRSFWAASLLILTASCAASNGPSGDEVYWDLPETGSYWVPEEVDARAIIAAAAECGAHVDGGIDHHIPIPPGYAFGVFHFVGENSLAERKCTIDRLRAVPRLTARFRATP